MLTVDKDSSHEQVMSIIMGSHSSRKTCHPTQSTRAPPNPCQSGRYSINLLVDLGVWVHLSRWFTVSRQSPDQVVNAGPVWNTFVDRDQRVNHYTTTPAATADGRFSSVAQGWLS